MTGILNKFPVLNVETQSLSVDSIYLSQCKAVQAFLFDSLDDDIIKKYIFVGDEDLFYDMWDALGISHCKGFYKTYSGLERLIGMFLQKQPDTRLQIIGKILCEIKFDENNFPKKESCFQKIYFGAPGTGKSYKLKTESRRFESTVDVEVALKKEITKFDKNESTKCPFFCNLGRKYSAYINDLIEKGLSQKDIADKFDLTDADKDYLVIGAKAAALEGCSFYVGNVSHVERVTFHPNYSYAQFVGTYKPVSSGYNGDLTDEEVRHVVNILQDSSKSGQEKYDLLYDGFKSDGMLTRLPLLLGLYSDDTFNTKKKDGTAASGDNEVERNHGQAIRPYVTLGINEGISYKYVPGPFMRTLVKALNNPQKDFLLIIEEINRANVAAVFGDVFQLLDRKNGVSEYPIAASEDIKRYLKDNGIADCNELKIPSNMYIWATMNSADQGVFPMDTAFKRRWEFEYIGVDDNQQMIENFEIPMQKNADGSHEWMKWNELRTKINDKLTDLGINEDKLLGPFFISLEKLQSVDNHNESEAENFVKAFKSKVLMYLFEDAVKMKASSFFNCDKMRYSEICKKFDTDGIGVFNF